MFGSNTINTYIIPGGAQYAQLPCNEGVREVYARIMSGLVDIAAPQVAPSSMQPVIISPIEKNDLQSRRDEVRRMVADGQPANGIPTYRGRRIDGDPVQFLTSRYRQYLPGSGQDTLFMHDLRKIDQKLAIALENASRGTALAIGTKQDMMDAIGRGLFTDGIDSKKRLRDALRARALRVNPYAATIL